MKKTLLAAGAVAVLALASPALAQPSPNAQGTQASNQAAASTPMRTPAQTATTGGSVNTRQASSGRLYRAAQEKLKADNLYTGPINGRRTDATIQAIRTFQTQHHLNASGYLDRATRRALGV